MALTPNNTYKVMKDVVINEKIIPDGTVWKDDAKAKKAGFNAGDLYKKQRKLSNNTGIVQSITIHNTDDGKNVNDDGELYTRATYNENMGSARIHFYVDELGAWQNLKAGTGMTPNDPIGSAEVGWHAGDGSVVDGGNMTSLSMEVIMNDATSVNNVKAKYNAAKLAAWLLYKHGLTLDDLVTHTYWVNKAAGNIFTDKDKQCTNLVSGKKWCPQYIFDSYNEATALKNWKLFKNIVNNYYNYIKEGMYGDIDGATKIPDEKVPESPVVTSTIEEGDLVEIAKNATYTTGKQVPSWVLNQKWYVKSVGGSRAVIDKNENGTSSIMSAIDVKYLTVVKQGTTSTTAPSAQPSEPQKTPVQEKNPTQEANPSEEAKGAPEENIPIKNDPISQPQIDSAPAKPEQPTNKFDIVLKKGDKVRISKDAVVYGTTNKKFSPFVYSANLYVREVSGDRVVVSVLKIGLITGAVHKKYIKKI